MHPVLGDGVAGKLSWAWETAGRESSHWGRRVAGRQRGGGGVPCFWSTTLDAEGIKKLGTGLGTTATYLDTRIAPAATKAAHDLPATTKALQEDGNRLGSLLRKTGPNLKAAKEIHDSLHRFAGGLDQLSNKLDAGRYDALREGFQGLESSLTTGADQVESRRCSEMSPRKPPASPRAGPRSPPTSARSCAIRNEPWMNSAAVLTT
jgi:hypothetical protein